VIGRFTTIDPIPDEEDQESWTPYHYCFNNPVKNVDPDGKNPILGALIGAGVDYGFQVAGNLMSGKSGVDAFTDVDVKSIVVSGLAGAATSGLSALEARGAFAAAGRLAKYVPAAASTAVDVGESVSKQALSKEGKVTLGQTVSDVASNKVAGAIANKLDGALGIKTAERQLDRAQRVSAGDPTSSGRAAAVKSAQTSLDVRNGVKQAAGGVLGNTVQNTSNAVRGGSPVKSTPLPMVQQDKTKYKPMMFRN